MYGFVNHLWFHPDRFQIPCCWKNELNYYFAKKFHLYIWLWIYQISSFEFNSVKLNKFRLMNCWQSYQKFSTCTYQVRSWKNYHEERKYNEINSESSEIDTFSVTKFHFPDVSIFHLESGTPVRHSCPLIVPLSGEPPILRNGISIPRVWTLDFPTTTR